MSYKFRKEIRLSEYDYSQKGCYFITVCTNFKNHLLAYPNPRVVAGFHACITPDLILTQIGKEVEKTFQFINNNYPDVEISKYCIMPNHIHFLIFLSGNLDIDGGQENSPLSDVVGKLKSFTTKRYKEIIKNPKGILWQRNYFEHIIRNDEDYCEKWKYIDDNSYKWQSDEYYSTNR